MFYRETCSNMNNIVIKLPSLCCSDVYQIMLWLDIESYQVIIQDKKNNSRQSILIGCGVEIGLGTLGFSIIYISGLSYYS